MNSESPAAIWLAADPVMRDALGKAERWAKISVTILIVGQPGTGKTLLARHIHMLSRRTGRFVERSLVGIPDALATSILGGHERGAFTGADHSAPGLFEAANGGSLFLDEVALASMHVQEELLTILGASQIYRLGDARPRPIDTRVIFATNENISDRVRAGQFRRDLQDRIGQFEIPLPPLSARRDALLPMAYHFIAHWAEHDHHSPPVSVSDDVAEAFLAAPWTGNLRELEGVCRYAVCEATNDTAVRMRHLPPAFRRSVREGGAHSSPGPKPRYSRAEVAEAVAQNDGNKAAAARMLSLTPRMVLRILKAQGS